MHETNNNSPRKGEEMATVKSDRYLKLGEKIREEKFPHLQGCRIAWIASDKAKKSRGKVVFAETKKFDKEKLSWLTEQKYDFTITVYEPNCVDFYFDDKKLAILLEHELMHVGYDIDTEECFLIPHDAEEFKEIIRQYGIDWAERFEEEPKAAEEPEKEEEQEDE